VLAAVSAATSTLGGRFGVTTRVSRTLPQRGSYAHHRPPAGRGCSGCVKLISAMKSVREAAVRGKKVLVRCDLDAPLSGGVMTDDFRLRACLPTLEYLVANEAKIIVCGHLGRPGGEVVSELRLDPVAKILSAHLGAVYKADEVVGPVVSDVASTMEGGDVLLLENLRFHPGEENNDSQFAEELSSLADLYVNEAFAVCHREHASVVGVPQHLLAYAGLRLQEEVATLTAVRDDPPRPLVFIIGGAKAETKSPLVRKIAAYADKVLLGGKLMFEKSLVGVPNTVFPVDAKDDYDVGPESIELFKKGLAAAGTVVWNGPLGKWEEEQYAGGTRQIAQHLAGSKAKVIVGGGDTLAALTACGLRDKMSFVSTGGGAMLAFLAGERLPGLEALE